MLLGAIDVGTNSIHLIVVELDPRFGTSRTILKAREMVRLGGGDALTRGYLPRKAMQRGVEAIARFAAEARRAGAEEVRAVATSAVREAENRDEFLEAVRETSGIAIDVLSDSEEARLIHLGVSRGYPLYDRIACIIDIGGGSTEFIVADAHVPYFLHSVRIGSLRLYERYLRDDPANPAAQRRMVTYIREMLAPVAARLSRLSLRHGHRHVGDADGARDARRRDLGAADAARPRLRRSPSSGSRRSRSRCSA